MDKLEQKELGEDSVESGRHDDEHGGGRDKTFEIIINYNGLKKPLDVDKDEIIGDVRNKAIALFGITSNQHLLGLFPKEGPELSDSATVKEAKVKKGDELLLRQSTVRAG
jgi:hypothetical protein